MNKNWKNQFLWLGFGQAISILSSSIFQMSIVWYLTEQTQSATIITFATLCGYLPQAILGLFTGSFIDRHNRKNIIILADLSSAFAALLFAFLSIFSNLPIFVIFILLAVRSIANAFQSPSLNAIIPTIVPEKELPRCSGLLQGFESISLLMSPALAAIFFNWWGIGQIAYIDFFGAIAAVFILFLLKIPKTITLTKKANEKNFSSMKDAIAIIKNQKGLFSILIISSLYAFVYFPIGSMYPLMTMSYFNGSIQDSSVVEIVFSAGSLVGSLVLGWIGNKLDSEKTIAFSIGIYGVGVLGSGLLNPNSLSIFIAFSLVMGFTLPFFYGMQNAIFQSRVPNEYLGRVLSLLYSISLFAAPIGLLFGGGFSEILGIQNAFIICGIFALVLSISMILSIQITNKKDA